MDPNTQDFINQAKQKGLTDDQIQAYMKAKDAGQINPQQQPQQTASLGGFIGNLGEDVGQTAQGLLSLPSMLISNILNPSQLPTTGRNLATGIASEYSNLATNPAQHFYQHPLNTLLDVLPFLQVGKAALLSKAGEAGDIAQVGKAGEAIQTTNTFAPKTLANNLLKTQYQGLNKTELANLDLGNTLSSLAQDGFKNIDDVASAADRITGDSGVITRMTRDAVSQAAPVNLGGLGEAIQPYLDNPLINDNVEAKVQRQLTKFIAESGKQEDGTLSIEGGNPNRVFEYIQQLQGQASDLRKGNATKADIALSHAQFGIANELSDRLYQGAGANKALVKNVLNQGNLDELNNISPLLAQRVMNAKTVAQLRSVAAPYVRGGMAADSVNANLINSMMSSKELLGAGGVGLFASLFAGGPTGLAAAGGTLALEKFLGSNAAKVKMANLAANTGGITKLPGAIAGKTKGLATNPFSMNVLRSPGLATVTQSNPITNQPTNENNQNNQGNQPPSIYNNNINKYKDQGGNYILPSLTSFNTTVPQTYPLEQAIQDLEQAGPNAQRREQIMQAYQLSSENAKSQMTAQQLPESERQFMINAQQTNDQMNALRTMLQQKGNKTIFEALLNDNPQVQKIKSLTDPTYASMLTLMTSLASAAEYNQVHGRLSNFDSQFLNIMPRSGDTGATALAKLDQAQEYMVKQYLRQGPAFGLNLQGTTPLGQMGVLGQ